MNIMSLKGDNDSCKLPVDGWIFPCYNCGIPTSKIETIFDYIHNGVYIAYICKICVQYNFKEFIYLKCDGISAEQKK